MSTPAEKITELKDTIKSLRYKKNKTASITHYLKLEDELIDKEHELKELQYVQGNN